MSDTGRKDISDQLKEKATPQDQKVDSSHGIMADFQSYVQQAKEAVSGAYDKVAAAVVPDENKSSTQQASDKIRGSRH